VEHVFNHILELHMRDLSRAMEILETLAVPFSATTVEYKFWKSLIESFSSHFITSSGY
jgi:hypothetical protein